MRAFDFSLKTIATALAVAGIVACSQELPKTITFPHYAVRNVDSQEITCIEKTDTATVVSIKSFFIPGWWIRIDPGIHLLADGKKYPLIGTESITPGKKFIMPKKGEPNEGIAEYKLFFSPLPYDAEECSLIESNARGSFNFLHIDLTGKPAKPSKAPRIRTKTLPAPSFDSGMARVEFVLGCSLRGLPKMDATLYCQSLFPLEVEEYSAKFDDTGTAVFEFWLNGTGKCRGWIDEDNARASFFVEPGGTVKVILDGSSRNKTIERFGLDESATSRPVFSGSYSDLNNFISSDSDSKYSFYLYDVILSSGANSGEELFMAVKDSCERKMEAVDADASIPPIGRAFYKSAIIAEAFNAIKAAPYILETQGKESLTIPVEAYKWLSGFELDSPDRAFSGHVYASLADPSVLAYSCPKGEGYLAEIKYALPLIAKVRSGESLTEEELAKAKSFKTPLFAKGIFKAMEDYAGAMQQLPDNVSSFPDLPPEHILDTILERYKGKTVLVTVWETGFPFITQAIKAIESDKSKRYKDVTFVYITGTVSPRDKWLAMIPEIKGEHYYLNDGQMASVLSELGSKYFHAYMVVAPDGSRVYTRVGWNDKVRDKLENTLKKYK